MKNIKRALALTTAFVCIAGSLSAQGRLSHTEYIERYKHLAIVNQEIYGIPASITMAQALLESDCGNSRLALEANNHFGIKCKSTWTGESILHDDDAPCECFRKYPSPEHSYIDHSEFLDKSPRYQELFTYEPTDYKAWAHGLKKAGYATNPRYAELLIKLIEDHQLYILDGGTDFAASKPVETQPHIDIPPANAVTPGSDNPEKIDVDNYVVSLRSINGRPVYHNNGSEFILAARGDSFENIASVAGMSPKKLRKINDMPEGSQPGEGDPVYLKAKARKATNGKLLHIVKEGETMHSISQAYGIKLKRLSNINRRPANTRLSPGQQIRLM